MFEGNDFLERRVSAIYTPANMLLASEVIEASRLYENLILGQLETSVDFELLAIQFTKPSIARTYQDAIARTLTCFLDATEQDDPSKFREVGFFVDRDETGVHPTEKLESEPEVPKTIQDANRESLVVVHTHLPSFSSPIRPEDRSGLGRSELYIFSLARNMNMEYRGSSRFADSILSITLQLSLERETVNLLLIRERAEMKLVDSDSYQTQLRDLHPKLDKIVKQEQVLDQLRLSGFHTAYLAAPIGDFFTYPPITANQVHELISELSL